MTAPVHGLSSRTATDRWEEALIVGNGRQGALCYGGPSGVLVTVSHGRLCRPAGPPGAATLVCTPEPTVAGRGYVRSTDFSTGVVTQRWQTDTGPAGMAAFVSRAHDVVALRLHGPARWSVALNPLPGRPPRPVDTVVRRRGDRITLTATFPGAPAGGPAGYTVVCRLHGPDLVLLRTVVGDCDVEAALTGVPPNWTELLRAHAALHRDLYHRVRLNLGPRPSRDTEDLLAAPGPDTVRLLFDAGRYAVISSSGDPSPARPGGNPPTAVAALHATGCAALVRPVFDLVEPVPPRGARHDAGRLARLLYDHWCYTGDRAFLADRALPVMRGAAELYAGSLPAYLPADLAVLRDLLRNLLAATVELGLADPAGPAWRELLRALPPYRIGAGGEPAGCADGSGHRHAADPYPLWFGPDPAVVDDPALRAAATLTVRRRLAARRADGPGAGGPASGLAQLGLAAAGLGLADEAAETLTLMAARYWRPSLVPAGGPGATLDVDLAGGFPAVVAAMLVRSAQRVLAEPPRPGRGMPPHGGSAVRSGRPTPGGHAGRAPRPGRLDLLPALPAAWPAGSVRGLAARGALTVRRLTWAAGRYEAVIESRLDQDLVVSVAGGDPDLLSVRAGRPVRLAGPLRTYAPVTPRPST